MNTENSVTQRLKRLMAEHKDELEILWARRTQGDKQAANEYRKLIESIYAQVHTQRGVQEIAKELLQNSDLFETGQERIVPNDKGEILELPLDDDTQENVNYAIEILTEYLIEFQNGNYKSISIIAETRDGCYKTSWSISDDRVKLGNHLIYLGLVRMGFARYHQIAEVVNETLDERGRGI